MVTPATYVDRDGYRLYVASKATGTSAPTDQVLGAASRAFDDLCGVAHGMFAPMTAATFRFDARGGTLLRLRSGGRRYLLRTVSANGIKVDSDFDGVFDDYLLDFADAWVRGLWQGDENASQFGYPYDAIVLRDQFASAEPSVWPIGPGCIEIAGTAWGFETTPEIVARATAEIAHRMRQEGMAGLTGGLAGVDATLPTDPDSRAVVMEAAREFSFKQVHVG